jgi:AAA domain
MRFDSTNIIGRDKEISNFFSILKTHSIVLSSHRRMGKTMLLKKMTSEYPNEFVPFFIIVEGKSSPEEFFHDLYRQLQEDKLLPDNKNSRIFDWYEKTFAGMEIKDMKLPSFRSHWKDALRKTVEDLLETNKGKNIIIMIDEFPMMLYKFIKDNDLAKEAIEMLDTLREIRQVYGDKGIKFIFCGSIGINIVLDLLRKNHHYAGEPINDMNLEILDAMTPMDAEMLANHLIKTSNIKIDSSSVMNIDELCKEVDFLPFYIDLIIKEIDINQEVVSKENIAKEVEKLISSPGNQGQFNHFSDRINTYYEEDIKLKAKQILNWLSRQDVLKSEEEIRNYLASKNTVQIEDVNLILKKLFDDLYIKREIKDGIRFYEFKYRLLKRWWSINLG